MTEAVIKKPLIPFGWLRVLIFALFCFLSILFVSIPVGIIIAMTRKDTGKENIADISNLMNGDFLWLSSLAGLLISLLFVFLFRKFVDRRTFASLGFSTDGYGSDAITGFFLAPAILGIGSLILFASGHLKWVDIDFNGTSLFISLGIFMMVAFTEELVFRGYILNNLMESFNKWIALAVSALLFSLAHLSADSIGFLPIANIFLAGILLGINYIYTKNLWFSFLLHLSWNFFQGPLLGYKVSGLNMQTLLQPELKGDVLLTGGNFGFEGSFFDTALMIAAILILYFIYEKKNKEVISMKYEL
jgi:CAAX protease family protein